MKIDGINNNNNAASRTEKEKKGPKEKPSIAQIRQDISKDMAVISDAAKNLGVNVPDVNLNVGGIGSGLPQERFGLGLITPQKPSPFGINFKEMFKGLSDAINRLSTDKLDQVSNVLQESLNSLSNPADPTQNKVALDTAKQTLMNEGLMDDKQAIRFDEMSPTEQKAYINGILERVRGSKSAKEFSDNTRAAAGVFRQASAAVSGQYRPQFAQVFVETERGLITPINASYSNGNVTQTQHAQHSNALVTLASTRVEFEGFIGTDLSQPVVNGLAANAVLEMSTAQLAIKVASEKGFQVNEGLASIASGTYLAAGALSGKTALAMITTDTGAKVSFSSEQLLKLSTMAENITETVVSMIVANRAEQNDLDKKVQEASINKNLAKKVATEERDAKTDAEIKTLMAKLDNAMSTAGRKYIKAQIDELKQKKI